MKKTKRMSRPRPGSPNEQKRAPLFAHLGDATFPLKLLGSTPDSLRKQISAVDTYIARLSTTPRRSTSQAHEEMDEQTRSLVARACLHRGIAQALLGAWPQAQQDFARVTDLATGTAEARTASLFLALAYDIGQSNDELAASEWTQLLEVIEARGIQEGDAKSRLLAAQAYASRARLSARRENYAQTIADCDHALALDPACAEAYSLRGAALSHLSQTEAALVDCSKAVELAGWPVHYYRRCLVYKQAGEYARAFDDIEQALEREPDNPLFKQEHTALLMLRIVSMLPGKEKDATP